MTGDRPPEYMSGPRLPSEGQICFCLMQNPQDTEKLNSDTSEDSVGLMIPNYKDTGSCRNGALELCPLPLWSGRPLPLSAAGEPAEAILVQVHGAPPSHWGLSTGPCAFRSVSLHLHV